MTTTHTELFSKKLCISVSDGPFLCKWRFVSSGFFHVEPQVILRFLFMIRLSTYSNTLGWFFKTKFHLILMVCMTLKLDIFSEIWVLRKWQNSPKTVFNFSKLKSCHYLRNKIYILEGHGISLCRIFFLSFSDHKS